MVTTNTLNIAGLRQCLTLKPGTTRQCDNLLRFGDTLINEKCSEFKDSYFAVIWHGVRLLQQLTCVPSSTQANTSCQNKSKQFHIKNLHWSTKLKNKGSSHQIVFFICHIKNIIDGKIIFWIWCYYWFNFETISNC